MVRARNLSVLDTVWLACGFTALWWLTIAPCGLTPCPLWSYSSPSGRSVTDSLPVFDGVFDPVPCSTVPALKHLAVSAELAGLMRHSCGLAPHRTSVLHHNESQLAGVCVCPKKTLPFGYQHTATARLGPLVPIGTPRGTG